MSRDLIRSAERWAACSPEAVASGSEAQMRFFVADAKADIATLLRLRAALEAEASEGERLRGVLEQIRNMPAGGRDWCRQATNMRLLAQRALIPEAPAREGE